MESSRVSTGIVGLDDILGGGLPAHRMYLVQGPPGVGKTTLSLQFLMEGVRRGERVLYITLSETRDEIMQIAAAHGWTIDGVDLFELSTAEQALRLSEENTLYATSDVELREAVRVFLAEVERLGPSRVVFDSLSEIRLLAGTGVRYRRQLLALKQYFAARDTTVLLLDDNAAHRRGEQQIESLVHGVLRLDQDAMQYGKDRRRLRVAKLRGSTFRSGYHDFDVQRGGLVVYPRLVALEHRTGHESRPLASGVVELDRLLGGGIDTGTATLVMGPVGTGKSVICTQYACAAAERGDSAALFLFEERVGTLRTRSQHLGMSLDRHVEEGRVKITQIDPAELAPDEFAHAVRRAVIEDHAKVVVIDSLNGYFSAMPEGRFLTLQMHELLSFTAEHGVATLLTMAQSGIMGPMTAPVDLSYLSDTIILLRYYELEGGLRKAISVLKRRAGRHEQAIRDLAFEADGLRLGPPLSQLRGVFTGVPRPIAGEHAP